MRNDWLLRSFVILISFFVLPARATPPGFESLFPAGGQIGNSVECVAAGKGLDKDSPIAWASHPGIVFKAGDKAKKFTVAIAPDVPAGPYLVRFHTVEGSSPPRIFEVGREPEVVEKEPNDAFADVKGQEGRINTVFNGVLEKAGDVDTHAIRVKKGMGVTLEVCGYALGSSMDPALRLLDARGVEIAGGHDTHNLDPRIEYMPKTDGLLYAQVFAFAHPPAADVSLKGSSAHVYRLRVVEDAPAATPSALEIAQIAVPGEVVGSLTTRGEEDVFTFLAKKGEELILEVRSRRFDATLRVENAEGKSVATADDVEGGLTDPVLRWKAPEDGTFKLVVLDRDRGGGPRQAYTAKIAAAKPTLTAVLDNHSYCVEAGKSIEVKITLKVTGKFTGKVNATVIGLPAGLSAEAKETDAKSGELKVTLKAAAGVAASQATFRVELAVDDQIVLPSYVVPFTEPRGDLLITTATRPWLPVFAAKAK
ncbi:MAG: hypothetical protein ACKO8Z_10025 [Prosthecobacter sp.]